MGWVMGEGVFASSNAKKQEVTKDEVIPLKFNYVHTLKDVYVFIRNIMFGINDIN